MDEKRALFDFSTLSEVKQNFSLHELVKLAKEESFSEWLAVNFYTAEAQEILEAVESQANDSEIKLLICKIFKFEFSELSPDEFKEVSAFVSKNHCRKLFADLEGEGKRSACVETQGELVKELWAGAEVIYLYGGEFKIPLEIPNKVYIGYNNAIIDVTEIKNIDLDAQNIVLHNLQVYLQHPINLKMDNSRNIIIINGTKKTVSDRPSLNEIFEVMNGRSVFESSQQFQKNAEDIRGVAIGHVLLEDKNYNYDAGVFTICPEWDFEYISILKDFIVGKKFSFQLSPEDSEKLYNKERKMQIFADFTYSEDKLTISALYLETFSIGRINVNYANAE